MYFRNWFESSTPSSKTSLYPMGYGGIGLYPPIYFVPSGADAIYYIMHDKRLFNNKEEAPNKISHLPGKPVGFKNWLDLVPGEEKHLLKPMYKNKENSPFKISHI